MEKLIEHHLIGDEYYAESDDESDNEVKEREDNICQIKSNEGRYNEITFRGLIPQRIHSKTTDVDLRPLMKEKIIPKPYFSCLLIGTSGSGKSTLLAFLLNNEHMYKSYFDEIIVFGRTVKSDGIYDFIKYDKLIENNFVEHGERLIKKFEQEQEHEKKNRLIIFEDISSEAKFMNSSVFKKLFCQNRHYRISVIAISHKYKSITRLCRLQASAIMVFQVNRGEILQIYNDYGIKSKQEFEDMVQFAFEPTEKLVKPFLYINMQADKCERFRKGFDSIIRC